MIKHFFKVKESYQDTVICHVSINTFVGQECFIITVANERIRGEIMKITGKRVEIKLLQPGAIQRGSKVEITPRRFCFPLNETALIGKVINCYGESLYGEQYLGCEGDYYDLPIIDKPIPLNIRAPIDTVFPTKIKIIDGLFTIGVGQRLGLFAPAGAGKTTTVSIMANNMDADVVIFAMIGERAREVVEFLEGEIGPAVIQKSITIVSTSEANPLEKVRSGLVAVSIARHYMAQGKKVVLYFDSLTRFARAQAMLDGTPIEGGIPIGVSLALSRLVENCGNSIHGSVTGIFTVLIEKEIDEDPIAHEVKSLIDGHLVYSTTIASTGRYPAIDVLKSKSRLQNKVQDSQYVSLSEKFKDMVYRYFNVELLIRVGEYEKGNDLATDEAIDRFPYIMEFLKQGYDGVEYEETLQAMDRIWSTY
ncbi:type III secretion system ATPase VscN2 [Shewanella baltica]|uniref:type III secretion system ATPase VscN2 n=1 Tax=Shewanella baltica TaxID=62322 RepID=UPI0001E1093D|nr:type III secretion system ATPase VscN2 [Shewanella baltica]AEG13365.1 H+transporting two-sector ATPase alpha/beta subunit central region [Shewanella baltica BA175]EHQ13090.1 H+transporting two-sector ATPase alpha/beta subunit central region [Shewanella baltica OS183]MCS6235375.1 type III secretion system ATPase [Shewanella baltica]MCS6259474.1 type III secretion system ATPase [Shewanella baltica]MCS6269993.1 type III secretion system ATPase [Shewanella baltica]